MTPRAIKFSAVAGLALAIALIGLAILTGMKSGAITGPEALGVTPGGQVWIGVDKALWRVAADGAWLDATPVADLGLPGPPSNLLRRPDGRMVATVRGDPRLFVLDPATAHVTETISPRWPEDLKDKGKDAINVAFAQDGRIAIATGGGHTVALFDAQGALLARTAPGTYRFTNGLWWAGESLWTTDTNRGTLRRLDGHTLAVLQSVELPDDDPARYLGPAKAVGPDDATAAMIRFRNGMIVGRVVIVRPDGHETPLPGPRGFEPTDLDWNGHELLATDGAAMAVHRWSAEGAALSDFGGDAFAQRLREVSAARAALWNWHTRALQAGVAVFVLAAALAVLAQRREAAAAPAGSRLDLSRLGSPWPGEAAVALLFLRLFWPMVLLLLAIQSLQWPVVRQWLATGLPHDAAGRVAVFVGIAVAWALCGVTLIRGIRRQARLREFEPVTNGTALRRLLAASAAQLPLAEGEHMVETFMMVRQPEAGPGGRRFGGLGVYVAALRWVVCTDQGVRVFRGAGRSPWVDEEFALADIVGVSTQPPPRRATGWSPAWITQRLGRGGWLEIALRDGRTIQGTVTALPTHARVAAFLGAAHPARPAPPATQRAAPSRASAGPQRALAALASFALPGLGQWWQGRAAIGLVFFLPWAVLLLWRAIPIAWTVLGTRADVAPRHVALTIAVQLSYAVLAAWDAFQSGPARSRRHPG